MGKTYQCCVRLHPLKRPCTDCSHRNCDIRTEQEVEGHEEKSIIMHTEEQKEFEYTEV